MIIDAALTAFAAAGYDGTTTADICRRAKIGSGTFFHYFPTKAGVLVAIIEYGSRETAEWFAGQQPDADPREVLEAYVRHSLRELRDPRLPGFVRAVAAVMTEPDVARALAADEHVLRTGLRGWMAEAQAGGQARTDVSAARLTSWLMLLLDGFIGRLATEPGFTVRRERKMLIDTVTRMLAG